MLWYAARRNIPRLSVSSSPHNHWRMPSLRGVVKGCFYSTVGPWIQGSCYCAAMFPPQFLSHYRAAFTTCLHGSQIASSLAPCHHRQVELGWRMLLHHGTVLEYNFYVESCNQLLHCPYGRAALLEGGIIWWLAVDGLGSLSESLVLDGPSLDVLQHGHAVKCGNDKQNWLWDDTLLDQDRDIICGVHKVYTSQFFLLRLS